MKKMKRFASAALAALLLAGSAPSALALDTTPPMYKQFGYDSAEDFTRSYLAISFILITILPAICSAGMYSSCTPIHRSDFPISVWKIWTRCTAISTTASGRYGRLLTDQAAREMIQTADYRSEQLAVQLNGQAVKFPDAQPEKANNRTMVPFRAIAEALGAEVDYNAGAITAKKNGQTLAFSLGGKQLTITDDSTGKVIKTTAS